MIVDDEPGIVDVVQRYFALSGYEVIAAQSGEEALKRYPAVPISFSWISICRV